jgi:hypothetical protein
MLRHVLIAAFAGALLHSPAIAQTVGQRITIEPSAAAAARQQEGAVRIQASINLFVPGPTGDSEDAVRQRDRARRMIYEMAAKECDLLREVLAKDCRLEAVTSNLNRQAGQPVEGYLINGTMTLHITLK